MSAARFASHPLNISCGTFGAGAAFHLISRHRHDHIAAPHQPPEVQRVPLEQLVLRIKALKYPGTAAQVPTRYKPAMVGVGLGSEWRQTRTGLDDGTGGCTHNSFRFLASPPKSSTTLMKSTLCLHRIPPLGEDGASSHKTTPFLVAFACALHHPIMCVWHCQYTHTTPTPRPTAKRTVAPSFCESTHTYIPTAYWSTNTASMDEEQRG